MTPRDIDVAIQRAFDGTLTEAECVELRAVLKSDPSARALYYEYAGLHQALVYRLSRSNSLETAKSLAGARLRLQTRRSVRFAMAAAAILILGVGLVLRLVFVPVPAAAATCKGAFGSRYTVEHADSKGEVAPGELKEGSTVRLTQGTLELKLRNGSSGIVLAPATFNLQSENRMFLMQGTARFRVSKKGHGFQVATPEMIVTDLGTEFGVRSLPGAGDEIHVFSGRVIARSLSALHAEQTLSTGQARICDPIGRFKTIKNRPGNFLMKLPGHSGTSLITNSGFEAGNPPPDLTYGAAATASLLPGWRFGDQITVVRATSSGRPGYGEGDITILSSTRDIQVGFNADTQDKPDAESVSIYQTFATEVGRNYTVRFEMGAIFFQAEPLEITAAVHEGASAAGEALESWIEQRDPSAGNGYNQPAHFTFTATSAQSTLVFTETSAHSISADPVIDNVSVTTTH